MREIPRPHQNFFISGYSPVFYRQKKRITNQKKSGKRYQEIIRAKKSKKRSGISVHHHSPAPLLAVDIVGPFLYDPFRRLTPTASTGLPGRGRAPVLLILFIIRIEFF